MQELEKELAEGLKENQRLATQAAKGEKASAKMREQRDKIKKKLLNETKIALLKETWHKGVKQHSCLYHNLTSSKPVDEDF